MLPRGSSSTSMTRKFVVGMAALAVLMMSAAERASAAGPARRLLLQEDPDSTGSLRMTMMHRDHVDSPFRDASRNYTFAERLKSAVERSKARSKHLRLVLTSMTGSSRPRAAQLLGVKSKVNSQQGEYVAQFQLGTPPQSFVAIIDSSSDLNWVQCTPASARIQTPHPPFNPALSSTYKKLACNNTLCSALPLPRPSCTATCRYQENYGDGTSSVGDVATETLQLTSTSGGSKRIPNFAFGCGGQNYGDLAGSDGIVGLGQGPLSMASQLGAVVGKRFAFCLVGTYEETTVSSPLVIGGDAFWPAANSSWTPIVKNARSPTWYYLDVQCIKVRGRCLSIPSSAFSIGSNGAGGTILDTGTTMTELVPTAFIALVAGIKTAVPYPETDGSWYGFDLCFDTGSAAGAPAFPAVTIQFSWSDFSLPSDNVFLQVDTSVYCLTMTSGYGLNIIGNMQLQNFYFFVNRDTNVIGWKPTRCDTINM